MIYLDYTSTTPVRDEVLESFIKTTKEFWGNPSSLHKFGVKSDQLLKIARDQIRSLIGAKDYEVLFTSCATESSNLAIKGITKRYEKGSHIITSEVEHPSVYHNFTELEKEGYEVTFLKVDHDGRVSVEEVLKAIRPNTVLVSIMYVNNEVGSIMPIKEIGESLKKFPKITYHVDVVQALGKLEVNLQAFHIDLASISAHKIYGLKGSGALLVRKGVELLPQQVGGTQEFNLRAGTVDVPSAVALAKAMRLVLAEIDKSFEHVSRINKRVRKILTDYNHIVINSPQEQASPYILNFSLRGIKSETFIHAFEARDIYFSTKSACSSKLSKPSRILKAMGKDEELASASIRVSFSYLTTDEEIDAFEYVLKQVMKELL